VLALQGWLLQLGEITRWTMPAFRPRRASGRRRVECESTRPAGNAGREVCTFAPSNTPAVGPYCEPAPAGGAARRAMPASDSSSVRASSRASRRSRSSATAPSV
jgi:hypothetical protein